MVCDIIKRDILIHIKEVEKITFQCMRLTNEYSFHT